MKNWSWSSSSQPNTFEIFLACTNSENILQLLLITVVFPFLDAYVIRLGNLLFFLLADRYGQEQGVGGNPGTLNPLAVINVTPMCAAVSLSIPLRKHSVGGRSLKRGAQCPHELC